jgi:hypothetical protein
MQVFETNRTSPSMSPSQPTGESTQESQDHTNNTQKSQYGIDDEKQLIAQEPTPLQNFIIPGDSNTNRIIEQNSTNNNNSDDAVVDIPDSENDGTSNHPTPCAKPRHVERNDGMTFNGQSNCLVKQQMMRHVVGHKKRRILMRHCASLSWNQRIDLVHHLEVATSRKTDMMCSSYQIQKTILGLSHLVISTTT